MITQTQSTLASMKQNRCACGCVCVCWGRWKQPKLFGLKICYHTMYNNDNTIVIILLLMLCVLGSRFASLSGAFVLFGFVIISLRNVDCMCSPFHIGQLEMARPTCIRYVCFFAMQCHFIATLTVNKRSLPLCHKH